MEGSGRTFIPAAGHDWLLPLYDPLVRLLGADRARRGLMDKAVIKLNDRVLDIGCGTGTLVTLIKRTHPSAQVVGLDPDPKALAKAAQKAARAGHPVQFDQGFADQLPYADRSFDSVFSSFMFHHLESDEKEKTLGEVRRVLKPGGAMYLLDFGGPEPGPTGFLAHMFHSGQRLHENFEGRLLALLRKAGFADAKEIGHQSTLFGQVAYYMASAPAPEHNTGESSGDRIQS